MTCYYQGEDGVNFTTATGTTVEVGRTIAVDPTVIPLGSEVLINGNIYIAEDTGGLIKGNIIDIYVGEASNSFGIDYANVYIR